MWHQSKLIRSILAIIFCQTAICLKAADTPQRQTIAGLLTTHDQIVLWMAMRQELDRRAAHRPTNTVTLIFLRGRLTSLIQQACAQLAGNGEAAFTVPNDSDNTHEQPNR